MIKLKIIKNRFDKNIGKWLAPEILPPIKDNIYKEIIINIGKQPDNKITLESSMYDPYHCQIVFDPTLGWLLYEKHPKSKQKNFSVFGTYISLKTKSEIERLLEL